MTRALGALCLLVGIVAGVLLLAFLASLLTSAVVWVAARARVLWSLLRFFWASSARQVKDAWRADARLWAAFERWARGHIVVQVLAIEPGDVVVVNFQPGVVVDTAAMVETRIVFEHLLASARAPRGSPGAVRVVVGKGMDVSIVRQVLPAPARRPA